MTEEEKLKFAQTVEYFGHWYNVISLDKIEIMEKAVTYIEQLEKENVKLEKEVEEYKEALTPIAIQMHKEENLIWQNNLLKFNELKVQIEKMKCCANCLYQYCIDTDEPCCKCKINLDSKIKEDKWNLWE